MRDEFLRIMTLNNIRMINVLEFVSTFVRISIYTHHKKGLQCIKNAVSPFRCPVIRPRYDILNDIIISIPLKWKITLVKCVSNNTDIP
jgi:hypothetical protein